MSEPTREEMDAALAASLEEAARHGEEAPPRIERISDGERSALAGIRLDAERLEWAGEMLYGRNWKTEMAEALGWRDASRVREMIRGKRPVPAGATVEIVRMLRGRATDCTELAEEIVAAARASADAAE